MDYENSLNLPSQISLEDLLVTHDDYDIETYNKYSAMMKGGKAFRKYIPELLPQGDGETSQSYDYRTKSAYYIPLGSGYMNYITNATWKQEPKIEAQWKAPAAPATPAPAVAKPVPEYWTNLNKNVDGNFTDLQALCTEVSSQVNVYGRGYIGVNFNKEDATDANDKEGLLVSVPASEVDRWQYDKFGKVEWIRTVKKTKCAPMPFGNFSLNKTIWTYYTPSEIVTYEYVEKPEDEKLKKSEIFVPMVSNDEHDFGVCPIFPVRTSDGDWLFDICFDTLGACFRRRASITIAINILTKCTQVFKTLPVQEGESTDISKLQRGFDGIVLKVGEDFKYENPDPNITQPAFKDEATLRANLCDIVQSQPQAQVSQKQNARQAASAKMIDRDPFDTLLLSKKAKVIDALEQVIEALKAYRGEDDLEVSLSGLEVTGSINGLKTVLKVDTDDDENDANVYPDAEDTDRPMLDNRPMKKTTDDIGPKIGSVE